MVGIVVVSHSNALARAAVALAAEMLHGRSVRIVVAAGLDETTFGTDAVQVKQAVEEADDGASGVLVLMDLGSAVLSAELALDLLDPSVVQRVRLCAAPLVEGLVAATVAAAGGAPLAEVESEAAASLAGKQAHLQVAETVPAPDDEPPSARATFVVTNAHGLHARPAARLVAEIRTLDARVRLRNVTSGSPAVPGSSLSRVATLGALAGHQLEVTATGSQAREAVEHVVALADRRFDDADQLPATGTAGDAERPAVTEPGRATPKHEGALPASPGIGIGPAWKPGSPSVTLDDLDPTAADPATEWRRVRGAVAAARRQIVQTRARTAREVGESEAAIFDAHLMLLDDAQLLDDVRQRISRGCAAPQAWSEALLRAAASLETLPNEYLRARAADVRALREQVLLSMLGRSTMPEIRPGVLIAADLTPAQAAALDRSVVDGLVLADSSPTAHSAILARSRGIPAVVCAGRGVLSTPEGTMVAVDGDTGRVVVDPDPDTLVSFKARATEQERRLDVAMSGAAEPAVTRDGAIVQVAANIGSAEEAAAAASFGADLAGLVRTEFLFLGRDSAPSVDEQEAAYRAVIEALDGRRAVFRTLDVGGDKPLPYVAQPVEANPFLGLRGIRLALARPELLRDQLRALCRVAVDAPVSLMFPMISHVHELHAARRVLSEVAGGRVPTDLEVGVMVEVPTAALKAATFVPHVDFLSIGTNDLTQYTLAVERGNGELAGSADPLDPGVLQLVDRLCRAALGRVRVAVCGETASDPAAVPLLLGLGVGELSVSPFSVPTIKQAVRELDLASCRALAEQALVMPSAAEVRALTT